MRWNMEKLWQKVSLRAKEAFSRILLHVLVGHSMYVEAHRHSTCGCEKLVLLSATFTPADRDSNVGFQTLWLCSCFIFSMAVNAFNSEVVVKATLKYFCSLKSLILYEVLFCQDDCSPGHVVSVWSKLYFSIWAPPPDLFIGKNGKPKVVRAEATLIQRVHPHRFYGSFSRLAHLSWTFKIDNSFWKPRIQSPLYQPVSGFNQHTVQMSASTCTRHLREDPSWCSVLCKATGTAHWDF